jgi:phage baseplate assembly protein W
MRQMEEELYGRDIKLYIEMNEEHVGPGADLMVNRAGDLQTVSSRENLGQAIMHRLLTWQGELAELGHPRYGSRLHELIGQPNNESTRELVRLYVKECITQERRVKEIVSVRVIAHSADPHAVILDITIIPIKSNVPMNLVFPYYLEVS